jgi:hypothetical protein
MAQRDRMMALYRPWLVQVAISLTSQLTDKQIEEFERTIKSICTKIK